MRKIYYLFFCICCLSFIYCKGLYNKSTKNKAYKSISKCSDMRSYSSDTIGYRIYLQYPILPDSVNKNSVNGNLCSYYWNQVFFYYTREEKIQVLKDLLTFKNDTDLVGIKVCSYYRAEVIHPKSISYTIQIDALYLFTFLTMGGFAPQYCPYPVLVDLDSGEEINSDQAKIQEVFSIYESWLNEYIDSGTNEFIPPLVGSKYAWYGNQSHLKKNPFFYGASKIKDLNPFPDFGGLDIVFPFSIK